MATERFELGGHAVQWCPPASAWDFQPQVPEEEDQYLDGTAGLSHGPCTHTIITIQPGDTYVIPRATMVAWRALMASRTPVSLIETYSDPDTTREWLGVIIRQARFTEVGGGRDVFNYSLVLWGGPM